MSADKECWSSDGELFNAESLGDLLDSDDSLCAGRIVHVGESVAINAARLCDADDVLDLLGDRACDIAGEAADDYPPPVAAEAKAALNAYLAAWIADHAPIYFHEVINSRGYKLTADDFDLDDPRRNGEDE